MGVIFDKKLTFLPHILFLRTKCEKSLNLIRFLSNTAWGADRPSLLKIYHSVIRSKLDYACLVYGAARHHILKKLDTIHHSALRICSGAFRTSPVLSLYAECCEPSLSLIREEISLKYFFRILSHPNHPLHFHLLNQNSDRLFANRPSIIPPFGMRMRSIINNSPVNNNSVHTNPPFLIPPWCAVNVPIINPFRNYNRNGTSDVIFHQLFCAHREEFANYLDIYTDGSKSESGVGCSYVCNNRSFSFSLPNICSSFTAEIIAIKLAIEYIRRQTYRKSIIYTDC